MREFPGSRWYFCVCVTSRIQNTKGWNWGPVVLQVSAQYRMAKRSSQPPHIFAVADAAYQALLGLGGRAPSNQCILIRYPPWCLNCDCGGDIVVVYYRLVRSY